MPSTIFPSTRKQLIDAAKRKAVEAKRRDPELTCAQLSERLGIGVSVVANALRKAARKPAKLKAK